MLLFLLTLTLFATIDGQLRPFSGFRQPFRNFLQLDEARRPLSLCTFDALAQSKCQYTVDTAANDSIPLQLSCVQRADRVECLNEVLRGNADMVVLGEHDYQRARKLGLRPVLYAREAADNLHIAVAPRNISLVDVFDAPIDVDSSNDRAFHAAALFNSLRGHEICRMGVSDGGVRIRIVNSADYVENEDEILICPNRSFADFRSYRRCNFEARLQRAVFMRARTAGLRLGSVRSAFNLIRQRFGNEPDNSNNFKFFSPFENTPNVLFRDDTVSFDLFPTYLNRVDERSFNALHCGDAEGDHDDHALE